MLCIGVIGGNLGEKTVCFISGFYKLNCKTWVHIHSNESEAGFIKAFDNAKADGVDALIVSLGEKTFGFTMKYGLRFGILLYLSGEKRQWLVKNSLIDCLDRRNIIIVNSDDKRIFPLMLSPDSTIITFGMNNNAGVTISSVSDEMGAKRVVCCIQQGLVSISGKSLEPGEFAVDILEKDDSLSGVLAACAASIAGDMEIGLITDFSRGSL